MSSNKRFGGSSSRFSSKSKKNDYEAKPTYKRAPSGVNKAGFAKKSQDVEKFLKGGRVVVGHHAIKEVYKVHSFGVRLLLLRTGYESSKDLKEIFDLHESVEEGVVQIIDESAMEAQFGRNQGAVLIADQLPEFEYQSAMNDDEAIILALDGVEDPQNLGAIIRTCWLMGVKGILIPKERSVGLTSTVHKVASGGAEHVLIGYYNQFGPVFDELKQVGFWAYGLSHLGKSNIYEQKFPKKIIFALGGEDSGLRTTTEKACDELVKIPQIDSEASYNVSVAAAIALTEGFRQIHFKKN